MAEPINLNHARKIRRKQEETRQAEENRIRFGRTGAEKRRDAAMSEKDKKELDGKKLDD